MQNIYTRFAAVANLNLNHTINIFSLRGPISHISGWQQKRNFEGFPIWESQRMISKHHGQLWIQIGPRRTFSRLDWGGSFYKSTSYRWTSHSSQLLHPSMYDTEWPQLTLSRVAPSAASKGWGGCCGFKFWWQPHILLRLTPDKRIYNFQIPGTTPTNGLKKLLFQGVYEVRKGTPLWKVGKFDQLSFFLGKRCNFIEWKVLSSLPH